MFTGPDDTDHSGVGQIHLDGRIRDHSIIDGCFHSVVQSFVGMGVQWRLPGNIPNTRIEDQEIRVWVASLPQGCCGQCCTSCDEVDEGGGVQALNAFSIGLGFQVRAEDCQILLELLFGLLRVPSVASCLLQPCEDA